jgi:hypothetical protein
VPVSSLPADFQETARTSAAITAQQVLLSAIAAGGASAGETSASAAAPAAVRAAANKPQRLAGDGPGGGKAVAAGAGSIDGLGDLSQAEEHVQARASSATTRPRRGGAGGARPSGPSQGQHGASAAAGSSSSAAAAGAEVLGGGSEPAAGQGDLSPANGAAVAVGQADQLPAAGIEGDDNHNNHLAGDALAQQGGIQAAANVPLQLTRGEWEVVARTCLQRAMQARAAGRNEEADRLYVKLLRHSYARVRRAPLGPQQAAEQQHLQQDPYLAAALPLSDIAAPLPHQTRAAEVAMRLAQQGFAGRARRALQATPVLDATAAATAQALKGLYPSYNAALELPANSQELAAEELEAEMAAAGVAAPDGANPLVPEITPREIEAYLDTRATGTGGGLSGWSYDDLKRLWRKGGPLTRDAIHCFVNDIANGVVSSPECIKALTDLRGIALDKGAGPTKPRPIGIGECFTQLTGGILVRKEAKTLKALAGPHAVGIATPGGLEALAFAVRTVSYIRPDWVIIKCDVANAFNCIARRAVLRAARKIPALQPYLQLRYGQPADITYRGPRGSEERLVITVTEGVTQGDPAGSAIFGIAYYDEALEPVSGRHPHVHLWNAHDDTYIAGPVAEAFAAYGDLRATAWQRLRLRFVPEKSQAYRRAGASDELREHAEQHGVAVATEGIVVVGVPVGTDGFETQHVEGKVTEIEAQMPAILGLARHPKTPARGHLQGVYNMVRLCMIPQLNYWLRTVEPRLIQAAATRLDNSAAKLVADMAQLGMDTTTAEGMLMRRRIQLPVSRGGMGLGSARLIKDAAYIGAWCLSGPVVRQLAPQVADAGDSPAAELVRPLAELHKCLQQFGTQPGQINVPALAQVATTTVWEEPRPKIQEVVSEAVWQREWEIITNSLPTATLTDKHAKALFLSASQRHAGAWVTANPVSFYTSMSDTAFIDAVRRRVGHRFRQQPDQCPLCNGTRDCFDNHAQTCAAMKGPRNVRHTCVKQALHAFFDKLKDHFICRMEARVGEYWPPRSPEHSGGRADIVIQEVAGPDSYCVDTVISGVDFSLALEARASAEAAAAAKLKHYSDRFDIPAASIIPVAMEPPGALAEITVEWLKRMAKVAATTRTDAQGGTRVNWTYYGKLVREVFEQVAVQLQAATAAVALAYARKVAGHEGAA